MWDALVRDVRTIINSQVTIATATRTENSRSQQQACCFVFVIKVKENIIFCFSAISLVNNDFLAF